MVPPLGDSGWIFSLPSLVGFKSQGSSFLFSSLPTSQAKAGHSKYRGRFEGPVKCCNILPQLKSDGNTPLGASPEFPGSLGWFGIASIPECSGSHPALHLAPELGWPQATPRDAPPFPAPSRASSCVLGTGFPKTQLARMELELSPCGYTQESGAAPGQNPRGGIPVCAQAFNY